MSSTMSPKAAAMELQDVRALAHKLWGQCEYHIDVRVEWALTSEGRDSPSAYKLLAPSVRKVRNVLEEVEENLNEGSTLGPYELRVLDRQAKCKDILCQLELSIQRYRCSSTKLGPNEGAVADLKTALDVACHELSIAYEALSNTGEIHLRLDTVASPLPSPHIRSASVSASSNDYPRKLSNASSAWSLVNPESSGYGSVTDTASLSASSEQGPRASEEKEVWSPASSGFGRTVSSSSFANTFAPDPLSIPLEEAASLILSPSEVLSASSLGSATHTRRATILGVPMTAAVGSKDGLRTSDALEAQSRHRTLSESTAVAPSSPHFRAQEQPVTEAEVSKDTPGSLAVPEEAEQTPKKDTDSKLDHTQPVRQFQPRNVLSAEATRDSAVSECTIAESEVQGTDQKTRDATILDRPRPQVTAPVQPREKKPLEAVTEDGTNLAPSVPVSEAKAQTLPAPPTRPPPPRPTPAIARRSRGLSRTASRYVIVNPTPGDEESDDELYTTSRPASPKSTEERVVIPEPLRVAEPSNAIPELQVNGAACENVQSEASPNQIMQLDSARPDESGGVVPNISERAINTEIIEEPKPPPIPPRPSRYRSRSAVSAVVPAALVPELPHERHRSVSGVTLTNQHSSLAPEKVVKTRTSIDASLDLVVRRTDATETSSWQARSRSRSELDSIHTRVSHEPPIATPGVVEFYGAGSASQVNSDGMDIDAERAAHIAVAFNNGRLDQAEPYLNAHLQAMIEQDRPLAARRVRHLLGVCASYKGATERAIALFISVLRTPISNISELDAGECAAAYWLGDAYALQNRRTEALLCYCMAERSPVFNGPVQPRLKLLVQAEQDSCQLGLSKADFKLRYAQECSEGIASSQSSVLNSTVICRAAVKACLDDIDSKTSKIHPSALKLDPNWTRSNALSMLHNSSGSAQSLAHLYHITKISPHALSEDALWPMPYDSVFCMANVARGRLLAYESEDLLQVFAPGGTAKLPRGDPLHLARQESFRANDLEWLIRTIRECLRVLEMEWSEVANVAGTWFCCRYSFMQRGIAQTHYFSISLTRQALRSGYAAMLCPDGVRAARMIMPSIDHEFGVSPSEPRRVRKLVRMFLEEASKERTIPSKASFSLLKDSEKPPAVPPRPRKSVDLR